MCWPSQAKRQLPARLQDDWVSRSPKPSDWKGFCLWMNDCWPMLSAHFFLAGRQSSQVQDRSQRFGMTWPEKQKAVLRNKCQILPNRRKAVGMWKVPRLDQHSVPLSNTFSKSQAPSGRWILECLAQHWSHTGLEEAQQNPASHLVSVLSLQQIQVKQRHHYI